MNYLKEPGKIAEETGKLKEQKRIIKILTKMISEDMTKEEVLIFLFNELK